MTLRKTIMALPKTLDTYTVNEDYLKACKYIINGDPGNKHDGWALDALTSDWPKWATDLIFHDSVSASQMDDIMYKWRGGLGRMEVGDEITFEDSGKMRYFVNGKEVG